MTFSKVSQIKIMFDNKPIVDLLHTIRTNVLESEFISIDEDSIKTTMMNAAKSGHIRCELVFPRPETHEFPYKAQGIGKYLKKRLESLKCMEDIEIKVNGDKIYDRERRAYVCEVAWISEE